MTEQEMKTELQKLVDYIKRKGSRLSGIDTTEIRGDIQMNTFYILVCDGKFRIDIELDGDFLITYQYPKPEPIRLAHNCNLTLVASTFAGEEAQRIYEDSYDYGNILNIMHAVYPEHPQFVNSMSKY